MSAKEIRLVVRIGGTNITLDGLRRALYNYVFARSNNGKFVLQLGLNYRGRQPNSRKVEACLDSFRLDRDEGPSNGGPYAPYSVAKRLKTYTDVVGRLLDTDLAYRCFCCDSSWKQPDLKGASNLSICGQNCATRSRSESKCMADDGLLHHIRFRVPAQKCRWTDVVGGEMAKQIQTADQLLLKPDFTPTALLASVVDNHTLSASHYVASSHRDLIHLPVYSALEWTPPIYVNIGNLRLRNSAGQVLSNNARHCFVKTYSSLSPDAVLNFLLNGQGIRNYDSSHVYSLEQIIENFDLNALRGHPVKLNVNKLLKPERQKTVQESKPDGDDLKILDMFDKYGDDYMEIVCDPRTSA